MSTEESKGSGYTVIWVISCFLFISIAAGGGFLVMYIVLPESPSTSWLPLAGVTLVCLPWLFWFLTFFYRVVSRACGFRMVLCCGGGDGDYDDDDGGKGDGGDTNTGGDVTREESTNTVGNDARAAAIPSVVVLRDQNDDNGGGHERKESSNDESKQNCSSSSDSIGSRDSETPLAYAMR